VGKDSKVEEQNGRLDEGEIEDVEECSGPNCKRFSEFLWDHII
jgi:hypothetical protein